MLNPSKAASYFRSSLCWPWTGSPGAWMERRASGLEISGSNILFLQIMWSCWYFKVMAFRVHKSWEEIKLVFFWGHDAQSGKVECFLSTENLWFKQKSSSILVLFCWWVMKGCSRRSTDCSNYSIALFFLWSLRKDRLYSSGFTGLSTLSPSSLEDMLPL